MSCRCATIASPARPNSRPRNRLLAIILACAGAIQLAGCETFPEPQAGDDATVAAPAPEIASVPESAAPTPAITAKPAAQTAHLPAPSLPFGQLSGMSAGGVTDLLGMPQFQRTEASAHLWQYRGESCVLDLFLYRIGAAFRVRYAEARPRTAADSAAADQSFSGAAADECLGQLAAARPTS